MNQHANDVEIRAAKAEAWDECAAAATGGGLTPLAQMLRDGNPYRRPSDDGADE